MLNKNFWKNKKVLITGNTGFKGSWLTIYLLEKGAKIVGISKKERIGLYLFNFLNLSKKITQYYLDIKKYKKIKSVIKKEKPDIIFHLAAQPIVSLSYNKPLETLNTNIIGTINILESIKFSKKKISLLNITTDKVYKQNGKKYFKEDDSLGGKDVYSSSKASSDLITISYFHSFFKNFNKIGVATARAGNVIGGFDWSKNRIIPDTVKAAFNSKKLSIRMPKSVRPWQHVLDVINGYVMLAEKLYNKPQKYSGAWNFGPNKNSNKNVITLVSTLSKNLDQKPRIIFKKENFHEEKSIGLISFKAKKILNWKPQFNFKKCVKLTAQIYNLYYQNKLNYGDFKEQINLLKN
tara:strand:+ start:631 stop:1680 length:1050 start_codon:yes stop_codon:yes gene_type:complete